ncbi:MAG: NAD(P)H-dependent oxidoreductase, partial [Acidobacteria bacterium]|nr:NAD(P)H-dependent oxidoreductase [Acidobacteriota bacterium]
MSDERPLFLPVLLGTPRQGRMSEHVARFVLAEVQKQAGVETELIDVRELNLSTQDAGEQIKDARFSATMERADGLIIVAPEYNHGYPGMLKHALDTNL